MKTFKTTKSAQKWVNENAWGECSVWISGPMLNTDLTLYPQHYFDDATVACHHALEVA